MPKHSSKISRQPRYLTTTQQENASLAFISSYNLGVGGGKWSGSSSLRESKALAVLDWFDSVFALLGGTSGLMERVSEYTV